MRIDIIDLRDFYAVPLGRVVARVVDRHLRILWPNLRGLDLVGLGYAAPFLEGYRSEAQRVINFMPAGQGVTRWPADGRNVTALVDETSMPLPDASVDRLLLVHCLENSEAVRPLLREIWRVLSPSGRMLIVTPNRRGLWARIDTTPFGHGRPFSRRQLTQLMRDAQFTPSQWAEALFMPPFGFQFMMSSWGAWENVGRRLWPGFSGLLLLEASKQIYALSGERKPLRGLRPIPVTSPAPNLAGRSYMPGRRSD